MCTTCDKASQDEGAKAAGGGWEVGGQQGPESQHACGCCKGSLALGPETTYFHVLSLALVLTHLAIFLCLSCLISASFLPRL